jgi:hypothetical protein
MKAAMELASGRPAAGFDWYRSLSLRHEAFAGWGIVYLVLTVLMLGLGVVDDRLINGVSVWNKPFKFCLSLSAYFFTLCWFAPLLGPGYFQRLPGRILTAVAVVCAVLEIAYIIFQASLGEASHFNTDTAFHAAAYSLMGLGAVLLVCVCAWLGVAVLLRHRRRLSPYAFAAGLSLVLTAVLGGGFGGYLGSQSGHWVGGAATDAGGSMLFHWARDGGDLRVAHFFGMHAMQVIPLAGWLLGLRSEGRAGILAVAGVAAVYSALTIATFVQALGGRPFL